jgi:nucleoside phosphorylase
MPSTEPQGDKTASHANEPQTDEAAGTAGPEKAAPTAGETPSAEATQSTGEPPKRDPLVVQENGRKVNVGGVARESRLVAESLGVARRRSRDLAGDIDALIVTAIDAERRAVVEAFNAKEWRNSDGSRPDFDLWWAVVESEHLHYNVAIVQGAGAGSQQTMLAVERAVRELAPRIVILAGIAAGRPDGDLRLRDLVVSTAIISIAYEKRGGGEPREIVTTTSRGLVDRVRRFAREHVPDERLVEGEIIATNSVVRDAAYRDELFGRHPRALALEMEGGALAEVCERADLGVRFTVIKAVVDFADTLKDDSVHQESCARVANFVRRFLEDGPLPSQSASKRSPSGRSSADDSPRGHSFLVPRSVLQAEARTYVAPPAFGSAQAMLADRGCVILVGPRHSGRRTAARQLLDQRYIDVYELDETRLAELAQTHIEAGAGYVLSIDGLSDADGAVRLLVERTSDAGAGLVVYATPGRRDATGGHLELCMEWRFVTGNLLVDAIRHKVLDRQSVERQDRIVEILAAEPVQERLLEVRSTREMTETVTVLRRALDEEWPMEAIVSSLGSSGRAGICDRIRGFSDLRVQAWFIAMAMLGPINLEEGTRAAEDLSDRLTRMVDAKGMPGSPFGGPTRRELLERIEARSLDASSQRMSIPGTEARATFRALWAEIGQLRPVLVDWLRQAAEVSNEESLRPIVIAISELVLLNHQWAFDKIVRRWAVGLNVRSLVLAQGVLRGAIDGGLHPDVVFQELSRWAHDENLSISVTGILTLGGLVGRGSPARAVNALVDVLRDEDADPTRKEAAGMSLALLLASDEGSDIVLDLLRQWAQEVAQTPTTQARDRQAQRVEEIANVLWQLDPSFVLASGDTVLDEERYREELATILGLLLESPVAATDMTFVLSHWARMARSDEQWAEWLVKLFSDVLSAKVYRPRVAMSTLLRTLATDKHDRAFADKVRARTEAGTHPRAAGRHTSPERSAPLAVATKPTSA